MNKTRRLTVIALLAAISFVLMIFPQFPLIPGASFLKIDFSFVPVLLGALMLDLKSGYAILLLRSLLKLLLNNEGVNDYIGLPMNIIAMAVLLTVIMVIVKRQDISPKRYVVGAVLGTLGLTLAMVILNYVYAVPLLSLIHISEPTRRTPISYAVFCLKKKKNKTKKKKKTRKKKKNPTSNAAERCD